ncbi:MAG: hypothetical protein H7144_00005 [Burkholderiales bacterium]|nr:hypothetical protein [Phycisphaerae bacterium]
METAEFETDALLKLLTDAIRRGPGSPEWHDAVERLRSSGANDANDYRLLMDVRDRLESGREYREVKAGPEFTRKLFANLDQPISARRPVATIVVSLVSVIVLVASVAALIKYLSDGHAANPAVDRLATQLFTTGIREWTFVGPIPSELRQGGAMKFETNGPLRLDNDSDYTPPASGSVWANQALDATRGVCAEAVVQFRPASGAGVGLVVVDAAAMSTPAESRGLSIMLDGSGFTVEHDGKSDPITKALPAATYTLRLKLDGRVAIAEVDGQTIWSGEHGLPSSVTAGVRFTRQAKADADQRVQSLRILAP